MVYEEFYEKEGGYGKFWSGARARTKITLNLIRKHKPEKVLDVGCGDGFLGERILKIIKGSEIYGLDISKKALDVAKKRGLRVFRGDINKKFKFEDNYFDLVVLGEILEHVENPDHVIEEVKRVVKKGGSIIISTPNLGFWMNRLIFLFGFQPIFTEISTIDKRLGRKIFYMKGENKEDIMPVGHLRLFTLRGLKDFLMFHKLNIIKIRGSPFFTNFLYLIDKFFTLFPSLSAEVVLDVRK